ncbi:Protein KINESIN LIGHT CHAIN-RELATED 3 [Bienertia sinuspersici]
MLEAFKEMEANFDERDLGLACLKIGLKLDLEGEEPEKILSYANRALAVIDIDNKCSLTVAMTLQLEIDLKPIHHVVQLELANTKNAMGRREEALEKENLRKSVEIKEFLLGDDRKEVGNAYRDLAEACVAILIFKEALRYCLKALEMHEKLLGQNSEVAHDRRLLGVIYIGMEEHEKALEQNQFDAAINSLKGVIQQTEKDSENQRFHLRYNGQSIVSEAYMEISMQYETTNEFETAISLLKRAHALLEKLPQEQHSEGSVSARIAQMFAVAKDVMDVSLGPHHDDSIEAWLWTMMALKGQLEMNVRDALYSRISANREFQRKAINAWEGYGRTAEDEHREACRVLDQLKITALDCSSSKKFPKKALLLPQGTRSLLPNQLPDTPNSRRQ